MVFSSAIKFEDGEVVDERFYPSAPVKNGYTLMTTSPNVSSDEYVGTYGLKPPSPPLSAADERNGKTSRYTPKCPAANFGFPVAIAQWKSVIQTVATEG